MKWIDKPVFCPICKGALGEPMPFDGAWVIQCWNRECRGFFRLEVRTVQAIEVIRMVPAQGGKTE